MSPKPSIRTINEPSIDKEADLFGAKVAGSAQSSKAQKAAELQEAFNRFWEVYPKKAGKPQASDAFAKQVRDGADPETIIAGAKRYADFLAGGSKGEFRPIPKYPQGWLNGQRWLDEDIAPQAFTPRPRGPQWGEIVR